MIKMLVQAMRAFGVEVTEADADMLSALIPQLPKIVNDAIGVINRTIADFDARLKAIEISLEELRHGRTDSNTARVSDAPGPGSKPNGIGV